MMKVRNQKKPYRKLTKKEKSLARLAGREAVEKGFREYMERKERALIRAAEVERERFHREKIGFFALWGIILFIAGLIAGWMMK